ncbi:hypothetical protein OTK49_01855 [Vibrio coralliirubri]|uniref:hypothetical protein n=1 Tax=Vibrio coralliirubri TaxID=1516159 RepID=UPI002283A71A|nr:hypothetical protein [Vibrio coralliirubri]MCY9861258.1 hypothetical protein [Vibrio coralliirubri]
MTILTLQAAVALGFKPADYEQEMSLNGKVLKLDFRTIGRGEWVDCHFSCAKGGSEKYKLAAFKNNDTGLFTPENSNVNFGADTVNGSIFVVTAILEYGRPVWSKAIKVR